MNLTTTARLRIVTLALTTILTATLGTFVSQQSYNNSLSTIDKSINFTIEDAAASPGEELSAALFHIEDYSLDQALFLIFQGVDALSTSPRAPCRSARNSH